ncbi:MAG: PHP domain-containing protein [Anaerolineales bacterium]|nr:PHP domain-containing protein [Anaerolineales bacterium]
MDSEIRTIAAELHVHTVLSPCASVEMIPPLLVARAVKLGIQLLAITDHNATANVRAVQQAAEGLPLTILPGMELQTKEEVHLLCIFDTLEQMDEWQQFIDDRFICIENEPGFFGGQFVVDKTGAFVRHEPCLLAASVDVEFDRAVEEVHRLKGLAIPAHIDRPAYSLFSNLGFLPQSVCVDALEITRRLEPYQVRKRYPQIGNLPLIRGGDVHRLDEFLGATLINVIAPTTTEIRLALACKGGRSISIKNFSI